ncbi:MAG: sigma-70 family RNA polymerase sigma factor [candidate division Zixibacteria bacterium]|jgi:RNA polymerase sigma-70 factor (ECF subfamily)|nr:sigma-70 family RNA polymerase sigma factor [candidate division Zixibacteria bacterium]
MDAQKVFRGEVATTVDDADDARVRELIARYREGDNLAFSELVRRYRSQVASLAYRIVSDYDEAADIAQDVFVKMSRNMWRFDERRKFYTWLYRITVNASIDYLRKHNRHRHEPLENFHEVLEAVRSAAPDQTYRRRQVKRYISELAGTLSDKQRSAFVLRDIEGCRVDDVATIMNMPEATVRWYLHRARAKLRRELRRRCPHLLSAMGIAL